MIAYTPTPEQAAALDAFATGDPLVIQAGAGTGKTSTLKMLAESAPGRRGLYVAYNRALADEAKQKFPRNVKCATAHSLAYGAVGRLFKHRLNAGRKPAREVALMLGINEPLMLGEQYAPVTPVQLARITTSLIGRFCYSADPEPGFKHLPRITGLEELPVREAIAAAIRPFVQAAWADLTDPEGRLPYSHDHYLKLWQLSGPQLPTDYILFDEAQDANPVIADVVRRQQGTQIVAVGDSCQAIYGWRGAVDAMGEYGGTRLTLSKSFRFGPAIADAANEWLDLLAAPLRLTGHEPIPSRLAPLARPNAVLTRSNAGAMGEVLAALAIGQRPALVGGGQDMRRLAEAAVTLKAGAGTDHPELFAFKTWGEVQDYCLAPGTRVLTADLRWQPIELLGPGDALVGFDEHNQPGNMGRRFRTTHVKHTQTIERPCYRVSFSDGTTIVASEEHRWLVYSGHNLRWMPTDVLRPGRRLPSLGDCWLQEDTRDAGWLAGMFDGEGFVGGGYATSRTRHLSVGQKDGPVLDQLRTLLKERGYEFADYARRDGVHQLELRGGLSDWLRLLGTIRPARLLAKAHLLYENVRIERIRDVQVTSVEPMGVQPVIALRTDHRTFIAEGLLSHNCTMDDSGSDLKVLVKLIDDHGPDRIIAACDALAGNEHSADVVISTAHKAKGREWSTVRIGGDFNPPSPDPEDPHGRILVPREEAMLAYVAVTRAQEVLDNVGLSWVKDVHGVKGDRHLPVPARAPRTVPVEPVAAATEETAAAEPALGEIPDGYYAVPDPDDAGKVTLWRVAGGRLEPSPARAKYVPVLLKRDIPTGLDVDGQQEFIRTWHETVKYPWLRAVRAAIAADPDAAGARYAETTVRCRDCGRVLTDETSKAAGRGPDCRARDLTEVK